MRFRALLLSILLLAGAPAQVPGPAANVLFGGGNNLSPADQPLLVSPDGSFIAVLGAGGAGDVVITRVAPDGAVTDSFDLAFPAGNDVHPVNRSLVMSRRGRFLCAYGSDGANGDLVFLARDAAGAWFAQNVAFPAGNDAPPVGTRPVISRDESYIVCRGSNAADLVIVPVTLAGGALAAGVPFNLTLPAGNDIPAFAIDPVIAPDDRSFAVPGTLSSADLFVVTVDRPIAPANTAVTAIAFPAGNGVRDVQVPIAASPRADGYAVHGQPAIGDLVFVPLVAGAAQPAINLLWPGNANTVSDAYPPAWSADGRLIAVLGSLIAADVILLPIAPGGLPGTPLPVAFPSGNLPTGNPLPPVVSNDARLVLARGLPTIGDLIAMQVSFVDAFTLSVAAQNILYPADNNLPAAASHVALAPDRSWCATTGGGTLGDVVITSFDAAGVAQAAVNLLYPAANNLPDPGITPEISEDGLHLLTPGSTTVGDAVLTMIEVDPATGLARPRGVANLPFPGGNNSTPSTRLPRFAPSGSFVLSAGSPLVGDLVVVPLLHPAPRLLAPADLGRDLPLRFVSPADAGRAYLAAVSLSPWPGILLADGRTIPLNPDPLFTFSLVRPNPVFIGFDGVLDASGFADASIRIPDLPLLRGTWIHLAFVTAAAGAPGGIATISDAVTCVLR